MRRFGWLLLVIAMAAQAAPAPTNTALHAFLDRDHVALGDTVTLNLEGADASAATPDLSPLQKDFDVLGTSSSSKVESVNGVTRSSTQFGIALRPRHAGTLAIPALRLGNRQSQPLTLQVDAAPQGALGKAGDPVFLEDGADTGTPYVGQQIVYTLKLFYSGNLTGGQLDEPTADGAQVIHLDGDARYQTVRDGQTYQVVERHYAVVPQHAGRVVVRGATFTGQMLASSRGDPFDAFFDDGKPVQARADDLALDARAPPASAGSPWLPAQSVQLKLTGIPPDHRARAGEPLTLTLSVDAVGAGAAQLPEPQLPPLSGARVYPDQTRDATRVDGNWLHGTRTRSFAIVPTQGGTLAIPAITLDWWNVAGDRPEQARLPAQSLPVIGAAAGSAQPPTAASTNATQTAAAAGDRGGSAAVADWRGIALASLALWLLTLTGFAWWRFARRADAGSAPATSKTNAAAAPRKRALEAARHGDARTCERALLEWAHSERTDLRHAGALRDALADPAQRDAFEQLQRARWKEGDARGACDAVAKAFARGFVWRAHAHAQAQGAKGDLPPLYPQRP
ncbi:MAG: protein BatD [Proteobacteria bacterium]|nr:protein BatD [Pseudomonadota bacterium]